MLGMMAGQERVGRQTPSERQRLLRTQRSPSRVVSEVPTSSGMRRRQSHMPGLPAVAAPPRPSPVPEPSNEPNNIPVDVDDVDDDAETRLFRPKLDIALTTRRERLSSRAPVEDRPSRTSVTSRP